MKAVYRVGLVGITLISSIVAISALTWLSSRSEGPITTTLDRIGTSVGSIEHNVQQRLAGGLGRSGSLGWFKPYRMAPDRLRKPDLVLLGAYDNTLPNSLDGIVGLERAIGTTFPLIQIYGAWGDKAEQQFPLRLAMAIS